MLLKDVPAAMRSVRSRWSRAVAIRVGRTPAGRESGIQTGLGASGDELAHGERKSRAIDADGGDDRVVYGYGRGVDAGIRDLQSDGALRGNGAKTPLNESVLGVSSRGCDRTGCEPEPLSTVKMTPVSVFPDLIRLVTLAFIETVKFAVRVALGWPLQTISMSAMRSARPSARTMGGTALVVQITDCADRINPDRERNKTVETYSDFLEVGGRGF
jgi:hypothetical protein